MSKKYVDTPAAPRPIGPYSQAVISQGILYSAGFAPIDPVTGLIPSGIEAQTRQVLMNLSTMLAEQGATLDDCLKVTVHLENLSADFEEYNNTYAQFFSAPFPVRTTVGSQLLGILVEIDVVVQLPATAK